MTGPGPGRFHAAMIACFPAGRKNREETNGNNVETGGEAFLHFPLPLFHEKMAGRRGIFFAGRLDSGGKDSYNINGYPRLTPRGPALRDRLWPPERGSAETVRAAGRRLFQDLRVSLC